MKSDAKAGQRFPAPARRRSAAMRAVHHVDINLSSSRMRAKTASTSARD